MTHFDEEMAALLALDALEPDEQVDAEVRHGTFPDALAATSAALAELAADDAPEDLRTAALDAATTKRRPGRPVDAPTPSDAITGFRRTVDDLAALLTAIPRAAWELPAHPDHGTVRELMSHLVGVEQLSVRWMRNDPTTLDLLDHVASTRDVVEALRDADVDVIASQWNGAAHATADTAVAVGLTHRVTFHDLTDSVAGLLVMRTFELWAHAMDIAEAAGMARPELDDERLAALSGRLMAALPLGLAYRRATAPGRTARVVLTGTAGGVYTVPLQPGAAPGQPDVLVVADTAELCRVAARRLAPHDLPVTVEGDAELAALVLANLDAFARD